MDDDALDLVVASGLCVAPGGSVQAGVGVQGFVDTARAEQA